MDKFLNTKELADMLGVTPKTIRSRLKKGECPPPIMNYPKMRLRFKVEDVILWFKKNSFEVPCELLERLEKIKNTKI